jgi:hypothetical protein
MCNFKRIWWTIGLVLLGAITPRGAADTPSREYQLKAAFIYNFAQFVEWPDKAFDKPNSPIVITVLGDNPFGNVLDQVTKGKQIRGREIVVHYVKDPAAVGQTHLLFIGAPHNQNPGQILRGLTGVLTIADTDGFMGAGGMIRFFSEENKLRFEINTKATDKANIKISAKLLQLAKLYKDD